MRDQQKALLTALVLLATSWAVASPLRGPARGAPRPIARAAMTATQRKVVGRARLEVTRRVSYDASYQRIPYPNGDVTADRGACTDLVVRALRAAGKDLQRLIHEDKRAHPNAYPRIGATAQADANIDHRRTPNHLAYFRRHGQRLTNSTDDRYLSQWQPGDLVYVRLYGSTLHCGVVSDRKSAEGVPLLIHNLGPVATEDDSLRRWPILGHFRFPRER